MSQVRRSAVLAMLGSALPPPQSPPVLRRAPIVSFEQLLRDAEAAAADPNNVYRERDARVAQYARDMLARSAKSFTERPDDQERIDAARAKRERKAARRAELAKRGG